MMFMRRPVQVYLDAADIARLDAWAQARGWTKSHALRLAVRALTHQRETDPLLAASGMIEGLPPDGAEHFDQYLNETYVAERAPTYRRRGTKTRVRR
jgi:hypothetical protein